MAISKIIYKSSAEAEGEVWMDVTQKTVTSGTMLSGTTALKNDGTDITGNIATKTSANLSASGATVTAPAGYYATDASKSVAAGSAATPATSITANPSISVSSGGLITASVSTSQSVTPTVSAGYVSSGTSGTVSVSGSNTEQLTAQAAQTIHPSTTDQTIASGKYLTGAQTIKAVTTTNLSAENIVSGVTVKVGDSTDDDCVASVTGTASSGYSETLMKNYIGRSPSFTDITWPSGITRIGSYAFADCAYFNPTVPNTVEYIGIYAFYKCNRLAWTSLPSSYNAPSIPQYAFYNCKMLALTSLPNSVTNIENYAFYGCTALALTSLPSGLTYINNSVFYGCTSLQLTNLPSSVTNIGDTAFYNCIGITSISCSGTITTFASSAFGKCSALTSASFPNLAVSSFTNVFGATAAANACQLLEFADIGNAAAIAAYAFSNCYALETLVIRKTESICTLANVSAFLNTPMRGYNNLTGTVYVPNDLIASYRSATNWSTLYNDGTVNFVKIEGSIYDLS